MADEKVEFANYKVKQNYYKNKYKNRETIFFAQQPAPLIAGMQVKKVKGKTYRKTKEESEQ